MGDRRHGYSLLVGRPKEMKPLGRSWYRWRITAKWFSKRLDGEAQSG